MVSSCYVPSCFSGEPTARGFWANGGQLHTATTFVALSPIRFTHFEEDAILTFVLVERACKKENNTYVMKLREVALKMALLYFLKQAPQRGGLFVSRRICKAGMCRILELWKPDVHINISAVQALYNNNNNNNNNLLQLGFYLVAVVILRVYKTWNWLLLNLSLEGYMRSM